MKRFLYMLALLALTTTAAHARDDLRHGPYSDRNRGREHVKHGGLPMMIPNEARRANRREGAKCMNAYPDDHSGFNDCIRSGRSGNRPQFMPMPAAIHGDEPYAPAGY